MKEDRIIPFLNYRYFAYALSIGMFVVFIVAGIIFKGGLRMGVDFVGGQKIIARFEKGVDEAQIRKALDAYNPLVQQIGEPDINEYIVSTKLDEKSAAFSKDTIEKAIRARYPNVSLTDDEVLVFTLQNPGDETKITARLENWDAAMRRIPAAGVNEYMIYKKESADTKKSAYNVDGIRSAIKSSIDEVYFPDGVSLLALFDGQTDEAGVREALKGLDATVIRTDYTTRAGYIVYKPAVDESEKIKSVLNRYFKKVEIMGVENVGPAVGAFLRKSAFKLITVAIILMTIYLAFRFEFRYSVGAMVAVLHDVVLSIAFCSIAGVEVNIPVVAALLTIFGYSVNDTIVIFDRIRESTQIQTKMSFVDIVNKSITLTMSRTILTSFLTLITVFALYLLGGEGITDFALVMLFGMMVGIYSTVYIASPVVISWEKLMARLRSR